MRTRFLAVIVTILSCWTISSSVEAATTPPSIANTAATTPTSAQLTSAAKTVAAAAMATTYSAVLMGSAYGMTCDGDISIQADGNSVDTDGLLAAIKAASALSLGAQIVLPTGVCEINEEIDIPVAASMRFSGAGIGLTTLAFFSPAHATTPVGNGLVFTVSNGSNLTIDDFTINRKLGSNLGTVFVGTAITVQTSMTTPQAGNVIAENLNIFPALANGQTDSWNTGLLETNITEPLISNVTISLPGWPNIPNPSGYSCSDGNAQVNCAIHALPSPANPVAIPSNLGFGTATGLALQGLGSGNYAVDSVVTALTVSGGLVGLDLNQFQGVYLTNSKFVATVYGVRANAGGTTSELLDISNSLFTTTVGGVYSRGVGGVQVDGNYIQSANGGSTNLPDWAGIWSRDDNNYAASGNNIIGGGNSAVPQYGIFFSAGGPNGFPVSVTGNTIYYFLNPSSVCMGNDVNMQNIIATGNSLSSCSTYISDGRGLNAYGNNDLGVPDFYDDGNGNVTFPNSVTVGTFHTPGSFSIDNDGQTSFYLGSQGQIFANGQFTTGSNVVANGMLSGNEVMTSGPIVMSGTSAHYAAQEVVGNFYFPNGSNPTTIPLIVPSGTPPPAPFPAFTGGAATIYGELTCGGNGYIGSWHYVGHYTSNGTAITPLGFAATLENDPDSQALAARLGGGYTITPIANPAAPGLEVSFGPSIISTYDCTATLNETVLN